MSNPQSNPEVPLVPGDPLMLDPLEAATDAAIAACDGDTRAAVRALVVAMNMLTKENEGLSRELEYAWRQVSPGFSRSRRARRAKSGEGGPLTGR